MNLILIRIILLKFIGTTSVSYTHLDVYKRQEYNQPTDVLLWINGKLEFKQQSLLEITNIMEKLYDIKFIYKDEALKSERFTGEFSTDSTADEILNVLMHTNHFSYKKDGRIVRVMKK